MLLREFMSVGQSIAQSCSLAPSCKWCDALLSVLDHSEGVCIRCYGLLSGAGITDAEIFSGSENPEADLDRQCDHVIRRKVA